MDNLNEIKEKILKQLKDNHQKSITEDSLVGKINSKFGEIDLSEMDEIKKYLIQNGITITDNMTIKNLKIF